MHGSTHTLLAELGETTASLICDECAYAFIAPVNERGITLANRVWLDRGDRSVAHSYIASGDQMGSIALNAIQDL